jgi:hypothetical protein
MSRHHKRCRRALVRAASEALEARRLLAFTVTGTDNADTIVMFQSGGNEHIVINNVDHVATEDNIQVNALGGNDTITIQSTSTALFTPDNYTINTGLGHDTVTAGNGNFGSNIGAHVLVTGEPASITSVIINDSVAGSGPHDTLHIDGSDFWSDSTGRGDGDVLCFIGVEDVTVNRSSQNDVVSVDRADGIGVGANGIKLNLGNGNNTVVYGDDDHIVTGGSIDGGQDGLRITGGVNNDLVIFNDENFFPHHNYGFTSNSVINQVLSGVEQIQVHAGVTFATMSGSAGASSITLDNGVDVRMGSLGAGVDLDNLNLNLSVSCSNSGTLNIEAHDRDANASGNQFLVWTTDSRTTQHIQKGNFNATFTNAVNENLTLSAQTNPDVFSFAGATTGANVKVHGSNTGDFLQEVNFGGNNNAGNLSAVFAVTSFLYDAGAHDFVFLDDSLAPLGNGQATYELNTPGGGLEQVFKNGVQLPFTCDQGKISLLADNGNNAIRVVDAVNDIQIDGNGGNDLITNLAVGSDTGFLFHAHLTRVSGGSGTDNVVLNDQDGSDDNCDFDATALTYHFFTGDRICTLDSSIENFELDESDQATTTNVGSVPATMNLQIFGDGGDDTFVVGGGDLDSRGFDNVMLNGGPGTNAIEFDDKNDAFSTTETETYNLNTNELDKGPVAINYFNFQSQQLDASTNGIANINFGETVNLNTTSHIPTTIVGCINRFCVINVGSTSLTPIDAPLTLTMGGVGGANINDQSSTGNTDYILATGLFTASSGPNVQFSGSGITLNASAGNNNILVGDSALAMPFVVNGNDGNDTITVESLSGFLSSVSVSGGNGTADKIVFDQSDTTTAQTLTFDSLSLTRGTQSVPFSTFESAQIITGTGGGTVNATHVSMPLTLTGTLGNDSFNIGNGNLDTHLLANVNATGGGGTDTIVLLDGLDTGDDTYNLLSTNVFRKGTTGRTVTANGFDTYSVVCNGGNNTINIGGSTPIVILGGGGIDTLDAEGSNVGVPPPKPNVTFDGGSGLDIVNVNTGGVGNATVTFANTQDLAQLAIGAGGNAIAKAGANMVLGTQALLLANNTRLDLNDNDMILDYASSSPINLIRNLINSARNGGAWNGASGITSTTARNAPAHNTMLGLMEATEYKSIYGAAATFDNLPIDNTALLVKYTYYGDTDFNGKVNFDDYVRTDQGFNNHRTGWLNGDFDLNGQVNFDDYVLVDLAFNTQSDLLGRGH